MGCKEKLLSASKEIHDYIRERAGVDYNPETGEGKQAWIKAAKELQDHSVKTINNLYADLGLKGFEKKIVPKTENLQSATGEKPLESITDEGINKVEQPTEEKQPTVVSDNKKDVENSLNNIDAITPKNTDDAKIGDRFYENYGGAVRQVEKIESTKDKNGGEIVRVRNVETGVIYEHLNNDTIRFTLKEKYGFKNNNELSEAYHKAKADGSNPELVKEVEDAIKPKNEVGLSEEDNPNIKSASEFYYEYEKTNPPPKKNSGIRLDKNGRPIQFNEKMYANKMAAYNKKFNEAYVKYVDEVLSKENQFSYRQLQDIAETLVSENRLPEAEKLLQKYGYKKDINGKWQKPNAIPPESKSTTNKELIPERTEETKKFSEKAKEIADKIREGKISKLGGFKSSTGFDAVWDTSLEVVAKTIEAGGKIADAIEAGLKHVRESEWYKNLNNKKDFEDKYRDHLNEELGGQKPDEESTGISHAKTEEVRKKYGLDDYQRNNATDAELEAKAEEVLKAGYDPENLIRQMEGGTPPTGVENFIIKKYLATLEAKFDKTPTDENLAPIERLVKATDKIGSLQSEAFRTRKGIVPVDESLAGYFITEKEVNLDAPLTEKQKETVKKEYADITEAQQKYNEKILALEAENAKLRAAAEVKKVVVKKPLTTTKRTHEDFVKERREIVDSIREKLKKARSETNVTTVPYAKELFVIAPDVAKLVKNLAEEGFTKLSDIVADIHDTLKDNIKGLTQQDIHNIIAGEYNEKKLPKNEVSRQLFELRQQATLMNKLDKLESGVEPKNEKDKIKRNKELEGLRKQIKEHDLTKLAAYKSKTRARIDKLQDDLAKGNYENPIKAEPPKLDKEAIALKDKLVSVKNERHLRLIRQQQANMSLREKAIKGVAEVLNIPRTLMTIVDYSAMLRQGLIQTISHPQYVLNAKVVDGNIKLGGAGVDMIKAGVSQKVYDRWFFDLKETPRYELMEKSKLGITDSTNPLLTVHEEGFMSNLAEKIPIIGKTLNIGGVKIPGTNLVKGSERSYSMFLNKIRVDVFNRFADAMEERGLTFENSPESFKQMAEYVNNSTGRGSLGNYLNRIAPLLNAIYFSPRLIASRLNMLTYLAQPRFYTTVPKEVRAAYFKDMGKFIGVGMTVLALAALNKDNEVGFDPRSSDFGKIKNKNTRWDIWGGFQQYIRVAAQTLTGQRKTSKGKIEKLDGKHAFGESRSDVVLDFGRSKLAPVPAMAIDLFSGRTQIGDEIIFDTGKEKYKQITIDRYLKEHLLPLTYTGLEDAMKDQGVKALFTVGVPSIFGVGTQTYESKKTKK